MIRFWWATWPVRVLLDENLPVELAGELSAHDVDTVIGLGWSGITNGELLRRAVDRYDALQAVQPGALFRVGQ